MLIDHPLLGPRDLSEFVYHGDACLIERPRLPESGASPQRPATARHSHSTGSTNGTGARDADIETFHDYVYLRDNPADWHRELWFHEYGDRSWLVITRNTVTHEIRSVELARHVALASGQRALPASPSGDSAPSHAGDADCEDKQ